MTTLLFYGFLAGLCSLAGGFLLLWRTQLIMRFMTPLIAFAAAAFLAVGFLDLLPEAIESGAEASRVFLFVLIGFTAFFTLERGLMKYLARHRSEAEHEEHTEALPLLIILGDSLHNFLDGVVIALAYIANPALALPTTLAIIAHEVPQEIADFAILLDRGWSKMKILAINVLSSLLSIVGVVVGYYATSRIEGSLPSLLAVTAGIFIYIGASDLIPEVHHRAGHRHFFRVLLAFIFGLVLIGGLIAYLEGAG
ncbi:MAG: ZIP family metal transporter [Patescibacteria group bacterium]